MPFIPVRDLTTYYEIHGDGPRLLYITGTGGDLRRKPSVFDGPLPRHFTVLSYDQRGLGQTSRPEAVYTMADYADDAAALLDALGWERCLVMGVSFGGMVAQEFALRHGARIERLVLACTSAGGAHASYPLHEFHGMEPAARAAANLLVSDVRNAAIRDSDPARFQAMVEDAVALAAVGANEPGRVEGAGRQLEARRHHDTYDRLPTLAMPVYICGGTYDGIAPPANLETLHQRIPNSELEFFEGGHLFLRQDPAAMEGVIRFLKAV